MSEDFHSANRLRLVDLGSAESQLNQTTDTVLNLIALGKLHAYIEVPEYLQVFHGPRFSFSWPENGVQTHSVSNTDGESDQPKNFEYSKPTEYEIRMAENIRYLEIDSLRIENLISTPRTAQTFFSAGLGSQQGLLSRRRPEKERITRPIFVVAGKRLDIIYAYAAYPKAKTSYILDSKKVSAPEPIDISLKNILLSQADIDEYLTGSHVNLSSTLTTGIDDLPAYYSRKLWVLTTAYFEFWSGDVSEKPPEALRAIDSKVKYWLFQLGLKSAKSPKSHNTTNRCGDMIQPLSARPALRDPRQRIHDEKQLIQLKKVAEQLKEKFGLTPGVDFPPELLILWDVAMQWEHASLEKPDGVRKETIKKMKNYGLTQSQSDAGAVVLRPESAPTTKPRK